MPVFSITGRATVRFSRLVVCESIEEAEEYAKDMERDPDECGEFLNNWVDDAEVEDIREAN